MKKLMLALTMALVGGMASLVSAVEANWSTDFAAAVAKAKAEKKMVLIDFTGSDWCGWCIKMDKDTFSKSEFADYAKTNLILVKLDFPRKKPQSSKEKAVNETLQKTYKVDGFPTLIALNSAGKEVWRQEGYLEGGPKALITELEKLKKK